MGKRYVAEKQQTNEDVGDLVLPIPISCDSVTDDTYWTSIGYPARFKDNRSKRMMVQTSAYVRAVDQPAVNAKISQTCPFGSGTSGGPWLLNGKNEANGVKVSKDDEVAYFHQ